MIFVRRADGAGAEAPQQIQTCESPWSCPVCAHVIKRNRAEQLKAAAKAMRARGGAVVMLTLTIRHNGWDDLLAMRTGIADAWTSFVNGQPWKRFCARAGVLGYARALEVTRSTRGHGWHPHLHVLLFLEDEWSEADRFEHWDWMADRWCGNPSKPPEGPQGLGCVARQSTLGEAHRPSREHGVRLSDGAAEYLSKLGLEVAGAMTKRGTDGGIQPWELLLAGVEDMAARKLWREYSEAMYGARQLTWSRAIRTELGVDLEDDATEHGELAGCVPGKVWDAAKRERSDGKLRTAAGAGLYALVDFVRERWGSDAAHRTEELSLTVCTIGPGPRLSPGERAMRRAQRLRFRPQERAELKIIAGAVCSSIVEEARESRRGRPYSPSDFSDA